MKRIIIYISVILLIIGIFFLGKPFLTLLYNNGILDICNICDKSSWFLQSLMGMIILILSLCIFFLCCFLILIILSTNQIDKDAARMRSGCL